MNVAAKVAIFIQRSEKNDEKITKMEQFIEQFAH